MRKTLPIAVLIIAVLAIPTLALAQDGDLPFVWQQELLIFGLAGSAIILGFTELIKRLFKAKGWVVVFLSVLLGLGLGAVKYFLTYGGDFVFLNLLTQLLLGLGSAGVANGWWKITKKKE